MSNYNTESLSMQIAKAIKQVNKDYAIGLLSYQESIRAIEMIVESVETPELIQEVQYV